MDEASSDAGAEVEASEDDSDKKINGKTDKHLYSEYERASERVTYM